MSFIISYLKLFTFGIALKITLAAALDVAELFTSAFAHMHYNYQQNFQ
jgi:hypothetical protein